MVNNTWFKLAAVSLVGIVISFAILWGIGQFSNYPIANGANPGYGYQYENSNGMNLQGMNGSYQGNWNMNGMPGMNAQGGMNINGMPGMNVNGGMQGNMNMNAQGGMNMSGNMQGMGMNNMQGMGMGMMDMKGMM